MISRQYKLDIFKGMSYCTWHAVVGNNNKLSVYLYDNNSHHYMDILPSKPLTDHTPTLINIEGKTLILKIDSDTTFDIRNPELKLENPQNHSIVGACMTVILSSNGSKAYNECCIYLSAWKYIN